MTEVIGLLEAAGPSDADKTRGRKGLVTFVDGKPMHSAPRERGRSLDAPSPCPLSPGRWPAIRFPARGVRPRRRGLRRGNTRGAASASRPLPRTRALATRTRALATRGRLAEHGRAGGPGTDPRRGDAILPHQTHSHEGDGSDEPSPRTRSESEGRSGAIAREAGTRKNGNPENRTRLMTGERRAGPQLDFASRPGT